MKFTYKLFPLHLLGGVLLERKNFRRANFGFLARARACGRHKTFWQPFFSRTSSTGSAVKAFGAGSVRLKMTLMALIRLAPGQSAAGGAS